LSVGRDGQRAIGSNGELDRLELIGDDVAIPGGVAPNDATGVAESRACRPPKISS
jgi:hypothetical protein